MGPSADEAWSVRGAFMNNDPEIDAAMQIELILSEPCE